MQLDTMERLKVLEILPKEGNFVNLKLIRKAREALSFSNEEILALNLKTIQDGDQQQTTWNPEAGAVQKDIELGEVVTIMVVDALKKLNDEKKLTEAQFSLYEKFIES